MFFLKFLTLIIFLIYEFRNLSSKEIAIQVGDKLDACCTLKPQEKNSLVLWKGSTRLSTWFENVLTEGDWAEFAKTYVDFKIYTKENTICLTKEAVTKNYGNIELKCTEAKGAFGGTIQSEIISIRMFEELVFITHISNTTEKSVGDSLLLECAASGSPDLKVLWRKENQGVISEGTNSATLSIKEITSSMNGDKYTCEASVSIPKEGPKSLIKQTTTLNVLFPPDIKVELKPFHTDLGIKEVVKITIHGNPPPKLDCRLLNIKVDRIMTISQPTPSSYVYEMVFDNITQDHIGNYQCNVENSKGKLEKTVSLILGPINLRITSQNETSFNNYYFLKWIVDSKARIFLSKIIIDEYEAGIDSVSKRRVIEKSELSPKTLQVGNEANDWRYEYSQHILNLTENKLHKISLQMCRKEQCIDAENAVYVQTPINDGKNLKLLSDLKELSSTSEDKNKNDAMMAVTSLNVRYVIGIYLVMFGLLHH